MLSNFAEIYLRFTGSFKILAFSAFFLRFLKIQNDCINITTFCTTPNTFTAHRILCLDFVHLLQFLFHLVHFSGNENCSHFHSFPSFSVSSPGSSGRNCRPFRPVFSPGFRCPVSDCTPCPPAHFAEARPPLPFRSFSSSSGSFPLPDLSLYNVI